MRVVLRDGSRVFGGHAPGIPAEAARMKRDIRRIGARAPGAAATPTQDLDDPAVQERIQRPTPATATIGGVEVMLYPLPAKLARNFVGLYAKIMGASTGPALRASALPLPTRIGSAILDDPVVQDRLLEYIARSTFPTAMAPTVDDLTAEKNRIDNEIKTSEYALIVDRIADLNGTFLEFMRMVKPDDVPNAGSPTSSG